MQALNQNNDILLQFRVPGLIQPKQRPRFSSRSRSFYTPKETHDSEKIIATYAKFAMKGKQPTEKPCILGITIYMAPPASWSKKKELEALTGKAFPSRSDIDNKIKTCGDAMNGIVFFDDRQIVRIVATQLYAVIDQCFITVATINNSSELKQKTLAFLDEQYEVGTV